MRRLVPLLLVGWGCQLPPPEASLVVPEEVVANQQFMADGRGSRATARPIARYRWEFGDGTPTLITTSPVTTHRFGARGEHQVALIVEDTEGNAAVAEATVRVVLDFPTPDAGPLPPRDAGPRPDAARPGPDAGVAPPDGGPADPDAGAPTTSCTDNLRNGAESDVDCGGSCCRCEQGRRCALDTDCATGVCGDGVCLAAGGVGVSLLQQPGATIDMWPTHVVTGHLDGDCRVDLVVGGMDTDHVSLVRGHAEGFPVVQHLSPAPGHLSAWTAALGDFTGDGVADVAVLERGSQRISVAVGPIEAEGVPDWQLVLFTRGALDLVSGDFNGDHVVDLAVTHDTAVGRFLGTPVGLVPVAETELNAGVVLRGAADFGLDGQDELVLTGGLLELQLLRFRADGSYVLDALTLPAGPLALVTADFTADGLTDVITVDTGDGIHLLANAGDGTLLFKQSFSAGLFGQQALAQADLDGEGHPDLVVTHAGFDVQLVSVLAWDAALGTWSLVGSWETCFNPSAVAARDFTGDGRPDVAVACSSGFVLMYVNLLP
ncbi:MAG: FG-GAP-like repeat-containing protein [Myxococcota bacterium]